MGGIETYVSGCATMTFPKRSSSPIEGRLALVDQTSKHFLSKERKGHISITHEIPNYLSSELKFKAASELLSFYSNNINAVITSRIHCAIPCAAMGIPVVYSGIVEDRTKLLEMIGIPFTKTRRLPRTRLKNIALKEYQFEDVKKKLTDNLHEQLKKHGIAVKTPTPIL